MVTCLPRPAPSSRRGQAPLPGIVEDRPTICGMLPVRSATILLPLSPQSLSLAPRRGMRKMTSRFRRLPAVTMGQAPRPAIVEDRSSSEHHNHRIWSMKTVKAHFVIFPMQNRRENSPKLRGNIPGIAGKNPWNRGEKSPKSRGKIPGNWAGIAGKNTRNRGGKSRGSDACAGRSNRSLGYPNLRKKTFIE